MWGVLNMNKTLKILLCIAVAIALLGAFIFAIYKMDNPYDPDDFMGLTYQEIIEHYGEFDVCRGWDAKNGLYRACGYMVKPKRVGYLGTEPPEYFMIYFNEEGVAYECNYETGGWGG